MGRGDPPVVRRFYDRGLDRKNNTESYLPGGCWWDRGSRNYDNHVGEVESKIVGVG